jgi:uncharacterized membrane protein
MKPLFVLPGAFVISLLVTRLFFKTFNYPLSGRVAMAVMLIFTAIGHFAFTKGMTMILPDFISFKTEVIYLTGIIEIIAAIGLLIPTTRVWTGWALILFFILLLPGKQCISNMAERRINFQLFVHSLALVSADGAQNSAIPPML